MEEKLSDSNFRRAEGDDIFQRDIYNDELNIDDFLGDSNNHIPMKFTKDCRVRVDYDICYYLGINGHKQPKELWGAPDRNDHTEKSYGGIISAEVNI